jgi:hypothetical protein
MRRGAALLAGGAALLAGAAALTLAWGAAPGGGGAAAAAVCIARGGAAAIQAALRGPGARALLCPHAQFDLEVPIVLDAPGQELATEGNPGDEARAVLRVAGRDQAIAVTSRQSGIHVHHVVIDGQRRRLGRLAQGDALIDLGGHVTGVRVDHVRAFDPRGWTTLHVIEGGCTGAEVTDNRLGPAGSADEKWADGISFACRNGLVARNTITDASDGAIVLFGAPGTTVEDNTILERENVLLGGINLVDYGPYDGDYTGVLVRRNRIESRGGFIKIGIAVGNATWGGGYGQVNRGGTITGNTFVGPGMGYGIVVDGAADFTVTDNRIVGRLAGGSDQRCAPGHAPSGEAFVRDPMHSTGTYQSDFVAGNGQWSLCVQPAR